VLIVKNRSKETEESSRTGMKKQLKILDKIRVMPRVQNRRICNSFHLLGEKVKSYVLMLNDFLSSNSPEID